MDDHSGLPFDTRIIPITCEQSGLFLGMERMSPPLPNVGLVQKFVSDDGVLESADLVSAIENLLIAYFRPSYNKNLKEWPATKSSKLLQTLDVDSLIVDFDGTEDTFALVTERRAEPERGFALAAEIFGAQRIWNLAYPAGLGYDTSVDYDPRNRASLLAAVVSSYRISKPQAAFRDNATV
ncbi:hypothetical protein [Rhodococcoides fascians]|uniref:hypothetical protein n=1 Tax=Rhodococcoides fascians TaxID=1828 RepID=UPI0012D355DB|nr:hypothetical protein [Rhodococcus fascians]